MCRINLKGDIFFLIKRKKGKKIKKPFSEEEKKFFKNQLRESTVTPIPKPGSKFELTNERGIFKLSVIRSLLIRLIYNRKYETIDSSMTYSNIGARRGKSCRNHIWIINSINYEHSRSTKLAQLVMQSWDYKQMFDSMSLDITF